MWSSNSGSRALAGMTNSGAGALAGMSSPGASSSGGAGAGALGGMAGGAWSAGGTMVSPQAAAGAGPAAAVAGAGGAAGMALGGLRQDREVRRKERAVFEIGPPLDGEAGAPALDACGCYTDQPVAIGARCNATGTVTEGHWRYSDGGCVYQYTCSDAARCADCDFDSIKAGFTSWGGKMGALCDTLSAGSTCYMSDRLVYDAAANFGKGACVPEAACYEWTPLEGCTSRSLGWARGGDAFACAAEDSDETEEIWLGGDAIGFGGPSWWKRVPCDPLTLHPDLTGCGGACRYYEEKCLGHGGIDYVCLPNGDGTVRTSCTSGGVPYAHPHRTCNPSGKV